MTVVSLFEGVFCAANVCLCVCCGGGSCFVYNCFCSALVRYRACSFVLAVAFVLAFCLHILLSILLKYLRIVCFDYSFYVRSTAVA